MPVDKTNMYNAESAAYTENSNSRINPPCITLSQSTSSAKQPCSAVTRWNYQLIRHLAHYYTTPLFLSAVLAFS